jgi:hypothetical protein
MKIYKYNFNIAWSNYNGFAEVSLPIGSKVLTIQEQENDLRLWAIVDDEEEYYTSKKFFIYGTGWDFPDKSEFTYFTTVQIRGLVWHIFTE